ncbi:MAG: type III PLP-dependent enzyme [Gammaproteobacteria bacterium]|nr:type III PLP-dependent enzyme [Gammaproteobacteria bacterium]
MMPRLTNRLPAIVVDQARALADEHSDPVSAFVYDLNALRSHAQWLKSFLPEGVELYYAIKANSEPEILETLAPWVDGFEISSGGEIQRVLNCSTHRNFIFSGPGKLDSDLYHALTQGVEMIHLESLGEIYRLNTIATRLNRRQPVLIRINPVLPDHLTTKLSMAGAPTPFGIDEQQLEQAVALVEQSDSLVLSGFHIHAMSHQLQVERHQQLLDWYLDKWPSWKSLASNKQTVRYLNVGGGMGVNYLRSEQFDWPSLCRHLGKRLKHCQHPPIVRFEPGRFVTAFCGYYLMQVLDMKQNHGQGFAVCRGGTHQFRLPAAQAHDHPVIHIPLRRTGESPAETTRSLTVVGQLCTPKDVLARNVVLSDAKVGDLLVLPLAGAYGYNISHADFLCHPRPHQVFIEADPSKRTNAME